MTSPLDLFRRAQLLGLTVEADGGDLLVKPRSKCPVEFVDELKQRKGELLHWLSRPPCPGWQSVPPDSLPLNPDTPRPRAHDREKVIGYMLRQGCDCPGKLTAWLVRRECAYYDGPGRHWDCALHAYAAARDAACWQLNRSERDVLELLASFNALALSPRCGPA